MFRQAGWMIDSPDHAATVVFCFPPLRRAGSLPNDQEATQEVPQAAEVGAACCRSGGQRCDPFFFLFFFFRISTSPGAALCVCFRCLVTRQNAFLPPVVQMTRPTLTRSGRRRWRRSGASLPWQGERSGRPARRRRARLVRNTAIQGGVCHWVAARPVVSGMARNRDGGLAVGGGFWKRALFIKHPPPTPLLFSSKPRTIQTCTRRRRATRPRSKSPSRSRR